MKKLNKILFALATFGMAIATGAVIGTANEKVQKVDATSGTESVTLGNGVYNSTAGTITWDDTYATITQAKITGGSAVANYTTAPRVYKGNYLRFEAKTGVTISNVVLTYTGTYTGTDVSGSSSSTANGSTPTNVTGGNLTQNTSNSTYTYTLGSDVLSVCIGNALSNPSSYTQLRLSAISFGYVASSIPPSFSLNKSELNLAVGGAADTTVTSTSANFTGTVTYSVAGADAAVAAATISTSTGALTITPVATASAAAEETLTVTATDGTNALTDTVHVTVGLPYSLITDSTGIKPGKVIIANVDGTYAATKTLSSSKITATTTLAGTNIIYSTPSVDEYVLGLAPVKNEYTLSTSDGKYIYGFVSNSYYNLATKTTLDADCYWSIAVTSGNTVLTGLSSTANGCSLEYYNGNFAFYSGTNNIHLYEVATSALSSIAISGTPNQQIVGQACDTNNLTVQATFADGSTTDVTNWVTWTPANIATDTTVLTASLTLGGLTKEAAVSVSVTSATLSSIAFTTAPTKTTYTNGESLDLTGAIVTATYSDSSTKDVTADCTFSPANGSALSTDGSITITATYQTKTATTVITVSPKKVTIAKAGTDNNLSYGNLPSDSWTGSGNTAFATSKTAFKTAGNYLEAPNVVPSVSSDAMTTLIVRIYSVVNSTTAVDTVTVVGLRDQAEITSTSTTIQPLSGSASSASNIEALCTLANSKVVYLSAAGINGVKITLTTKNANWVVTNVNLSYYTEDETFAYNFLQATNVCDSTGQANNVTSAIWSAQSTAYTNLSSDTFRNNIKNATANAAGTILEQCGARYDYIVNKYGEGTFANFMSRTIAPSPSSVIENASKDDNIPTAVLGATGLLAFAGAFFFLSKKKKRA